MVSRISFCMIWWYRFNCNHATRPKIWQTSTKEGGWRFLLAQELPWNCQDSPCTSALQGPLSINLLALVCGVAWSLRRDGGLAPNAGDKERERERKREPNKKRPLLVHLTHGCLCYLHAYTAITEQLCGTLWWDGWRQGLKAGVSIQACRP